MYCPKCGGQNPDELAYCRQCGEDLKIVSQAIKGHAPLEIASKIDAVIDKSYERFRRDAFFWSLWAIAWFFFFFLTSNPIWESRADVIFVFGVSSVPSALMLCLAGWNYLLYRRARAVEEERLLRARRGEAAGPPPVADSLVTRLLDSSLRKRRLDLPISKSFRWIAYGAMFWLFFAVLQAFNGRWMSAFFYFALAATRSIVRTWDLLYYRRHVEPEKLARASLEANEPRVLHANDPWMFLAQLKQMPVLEQSELTTEGDGTVRLSAAEATTERLDRGS